MSSRDSLQKLSSIDEFRQVFDKAPQMHLQIAGAISDILAQHGMRATGSLLGSLNFVSTDELMKLGIGASPQRASTWTI